MKHLSRPIKMSAWLLGLPLLLLLLLAAAVLIAVKISNWHDDPLSPSAQQALAYSEPSAAQLQDQGYLILMGLDAPAAPDSDPVSAATALGLQRLQREVERYHWSQNHPDSDVGLPTLIEVSAPLAAPLPADIRCPVQERDCFDWYTQRAQAVLTQVQRSAALLQRLQAMTAAAQLHQLAPAYLSAQLPPYTLLAQGHELWLAQAAVEWQQGRRESAMRQLQMACELRRRMTADIHSLIPRMVALAMHYRELRWISRVLPELDDQTPAAVTNTIDRLLAVPPPRLGPALEGEKPFYANLYHQLRQSTAHLPFSEMTAQSIDPPPWSSRIADRLLSLAYLPTQTLNLSITQLEHLQALSALPADQLVPAWASYQQDWQQQHPCGEPWRQLRNAVGLCMAAISTPAYAGYPQRIADVDGYRRLVLLQRRALAARVEPAQLSDWLAHSPPELRNPYTLAPMHWDASQGVLEFTGKQRQSQHPSGSSSYLLRLYGQAPP